MNFTIESEFDQDLKRWLVDIAGEIDLFNSSDFKHELISLFDEKNADIYIDCKELIYIDSTSLGALVSLLKKIKEQNHDIYLLNLRPSLEKLFRITNLDKVFKIDGGEGNE